MKEIKLGKEISFDLPKLIDSKLLIQANSGGGKSWAIRRILEQTHGKVQHIILDPEGEFATLREKFDYILAGRDGDTPADPKSAALLARKLLELKVSAVIDLFELHPQDRKRFVRLFLEAMVNAPKNLWHPVLVVIDEAHTFAPEKGESEALSAVIGLASLGRKRGFGAILATQRISKLHKDAAAECNNKLIGRTGLDIDRKRAAEEIGFTSKEDVISLRTLEPGEFYAFGPAISMEVIKRKVGEVQTSHPQAGHRALTQSVPPTEKIKKILGQLIDLPAEAKKEAETVNELKREIVNLKREQNTNFDPKIVEKAVKEAISVRDKEWALPLKNANEEIIRLYKILKKIELAVPSGSILAANFNGPNTNASVVYPSRSVERPVRIEEKRQNTPPLVENSRFDSEPALMIGKGERQILIAIAQHEEGISREHLTVLTGYKRSSRDAYLQRLQSKGYIQIREQGMFFVSHEGIDILGSDYKPLPTGEDLREHLMRSLPEGEKRILAILVEQYPNEVDREYLTEQTGYQRSSRDAYVQRLTARQLVSSPRTGFVRASEKLFN